MRAPRPVSLTVILLLAALLATACGGGPAPQAWAAAVCQSLSPWRTEIGTLTERTQQQMTAETTPAQAQENLVRLFGGAESASEAARQGVERAGVPDVDDGEAVTKEFLASLSEVRDAYRKARVGVEQLDIRAAEPFYDGVRAVVDVLNAEYGRSALDTSALDSPELKRAFDEVPECR